MARDDTHQSRSSSNRSTRGVAALLIAAMAGAALAPLASVAAQEGPAPCGAGPGGISGTVRVANVTGLAPGTVKVVAYRPNPGGPPSCALPPQTLSGDFAAGAPYSFSGIDAGAPYNVTAWLDNNTDGQPGPGELLAEQGNVDASASPVVPLTIDPTPGGGHGGPGPGPGPGASCAGTGSISGHILVPDGVGPGDQGVVRARAEGCTHTIVFAGNLSANTSFAFLGIAGVYTVEAWGDDDHDGQPSAGEAILTIPGVDAVHNRTDLAFDFTQGGPGGPGGAPGAPQGGGDHWVNGSWTYNGTRAATQIFLAAMRQGAEEGPHGPEFGQDFVFGVVAASCTGSACSGAYNVSGLHVSDWEIFTWMETDGVGGPGAYEPLGFLRVGGADAPDNVVNVSGNRTDVSIEYRDPPGDEGWPQDMLPTGPGDHGGDCDAPSAATGNVTGTISDEFGGPVTDGGVDFVNLTSNFRTFTRVDGSGQYRCALTPGSYRVEAHSPRGFGFVEVTVNASEDVFANLTVSFNTRPPYQRPTTFFGGTAWGNVTAAGVGVDGARVSVFRSPEEGSFGPGPCEGSDPQTLRLSTCGGEAETNSTGGFVVTYLANGTYDIFVDGSQANPPVSSQFFPRALTVTNASGGAVDLHPLAPFAFSAPSYVRGYVLSSGGAPVPFAEVNAFPSCTPENPCGPGGFDQTNASGYYEIVVQPGLYGMFVRTGHGYSGPPLASANLECHPGPGAECVNVTESSVTWRNFTLQAGAVVSGRIQDSDGRGVRAFLNAVSCPPPAPGPSPPAPCEFAWGQTDFGFGPEPSGHYNITLQPGTYELRIEPDRFERPDLSTTTVSGVHVTQGNTTWVNATLGAGARLRGNVTAGGAAVPHVNLFAQPHVEHDGPGGGFFGPPVAYAFTSAGGAYDMRGLPAGSYDIVVEPGFGSAFMRTTIENVTVSASETRWLDVALSGGGTIEGYVLASDGQPVRGASVDAYWQPDFEPGPGGPGPGPVEFPASGGFGHAQTDANGFYRIGGLANGTFGMFVHPPFGTSYTSAHLDAFRDDLPDVEVDRTTRVNFTLSAGGQIAGCVKAPDGSTAVPFAWVSAFSHASGFGGGEPTGPDGCFTIRGVAPGAYELEVNPPFGSDAGRARLQGVRVQASETTNVGNVVLSAGVRLAGRVLDADGNPVANAFVNAFQVMEGPGAGPGAFGFAQTDSLGRYNISGLVPGRYGMHVQPPFGSQHSSKFVPDVVVNETGRFGHDITIGGGGAIEGVVTAGGAPLAHAWVGAWSFNGGSGSGAITDSEGRYRLTGLSPADDYNLDVFPPFSRQDLAGHHQFPLTVASSATTWHNATLATGGTLTGRVLDANGAGVQFAFINVNGDGTFGWGTTDSAGNFSVRGLSASAGAQLDVFVQPGPGQAFVPKRVAHTWAPDADSVSSAGDITLSGGVNLTGRVLRGGAGVEGVDVFVWPGMPYFGPPIGGQATTGPGGWFNVTGLPSGQGWDVSAQPRDGAAGNFTPYAAWTNASTTYLEVNLTGGGSLSVQVVDGASEPVAGARVDCFNPALRAGRGNATDANGYANATGLPAGDYGCRILADGYQPTSRNVTVAADATTSLQVALNATATVTLYGNFSTGNSSSPSGYFVVVVPNGTVSDDEATGFNVTSSTGAFVVSGMPPAAYDVTILDSGGTAVAARWNVTVPPGATFSLATITAGEFSTGS